MTVSRGSLCAAYAAIGVVATVATWGHILGLVAESGILAGTLRFWQEALATPVSRFLAFDLLFLGLAVVLWMVLEARRLGIPGVWLYVIAGLGVAISVAVPAFLIHRELHRARLEPAARGATLRTADALGLAFLFAAFTAYAVASFAR
jgi:hypothetical protein